MLDIAAEYSRGRILMVLTTNLDAQRPVVWNMGEIARAGDDKALDLFRKVILASAAIPGAFPPVSIDVEAGGNLTKKCMSMAARCAKSSSCRCKRPSRLSIRFMRRSPLRKLYIIKNGKITPETKVVEPKTLPIATRAIATLIKSQNWGELYRIWRLARDDNADFNLIAVPPSFIRKTKEFYDPEYQEALFQLGFQLGREPGHWMKEPPGQTPIGAR